jgi:hypothetical protein
MLALIALAVPTILSLNLSAIPFQGKPQLTENNKEL